MSKIRGLADVADQTYALAPTPGDLADVELSLGLPVHAGQAFFRWAISFAAVAALWC